MTLSVQEKLFQYVDAHLPSYLSRWEDLHQQIAMEGAVPPSRLDALKAHIRAYGLDAVWYSEDYTLLYAHLQTVAPRTLLLYHQYRTPIPAMQTLASIAATAAAIDAYQQSVGPLPIMLKWLLASREGSRMIEQEIAQFQADGCLYCVPWEGVSAGECVPAPPILALGTKGLLRVELAVEASIPDVPSGYGGIMPNAAWRLTWALGCLKNAQEDILIEGFYDTIVAPKDDAIVSLSSGSLAHLLDGSSILPGLSSFGLYYAWLLTPTCTLNAIDGGTFSDESVRSSIDTGMTLPNQARARVDFHLVPKQDPHDIFAKLQRHLQAQGFSDITIRLLAARPTALTALSDPFVRIVERATARAYQEKPLLLPLAATSYPIAPLRELADMPVVLNMERGLFIANAQGQFTISAQNFAACIKQIAIIIEKVGKPGL